VIVAPARGWLIDTNVVSELRKGPRANRAVRAWSERVAPNACYISRISLAEIRFGIEQVPDPGFRAELEIWMRDSVLAWFGARVLEVDEDVLVRWRLLSAQARRDNRTYPQMDVLIAATALVHQLAVVTRNVTDFERTGVRVFDPWA